MTHLFRDTFFRFDFGEDRVSHCTIPVSRWRDLLISTGFDCITFSGSHPDEDHSLAFLAQKANGIRHILPQLENGQTVSDCSSDVTQYSPIANGKEIDSDQTLEEICISDPVFVYEYEREMELRDKLVKLDASEKLSVWIMATDGLDGDSGRGLVRTLIKEFTAWTIRLIVFDGSWSVSKRVAAVLEFQKNPLHESEIKVNASGEIYTPRIVPLPEPSSHVVFDASRPWARIDGKMVHISPAPRGKHDISINVLHWSSTDEDYPRAFLGTVACDGVSQFPKDSLVMGITSAPVTNFLVVHGGSVIPSKARHSRLLADVPGMVTASLALGPGTLTRFGRLEGIGRVLVTDVHTPVGLAAARFCLALGLNTFCIGEGDAARLSEKLQVPINRVSVAPNAAWVAQQRGPYDVILSGSRSKPSTQVLHQLASPTGTVFLWNSSLQGLSSYLQRDCWSVALALNTALEVIPQDFVSRSPSVHIDAVARDANDLQVLERTTLFDPTKTYVLVGGIGGIGIQMAIWMYKVCTQTVLKHDDCPDAWFLFNRMGHETLF